MVLAARIHAPGGPEAIVVEAIELPPPAANEARVRHTAIGVNYLDTYHRSGLYKVPLPAVLGVEAAGVVEAIGADVKRVKVGDRVAYAGGVAPGAYAEARNAPAERWIVAMPAMRLLGSCNTMTDPTPDTSKPARKLSSLTMVWRRVLHYPGHVAAAICALCVSAGATLGIPYGLKRVIDRGFSAGIDPHGVTVSFQYLLMIVGVLAIATAIRFWFVSWLGERVVADVRIEVQRNLLRLSPRFFEENRPSEIASRLTAGHHGDRASRGRHGLHRITQYRPSR